MGYSLKGTGQATELTACVMVDQDGSTIKEFVSSTINADMTVDSGVTISTSSWKSTTYPYISTTTNGAFDYKGVRFGTNKPTVSLGNGGAGVGVFCAMAGMSAGQSVAVCLEIGSGEGIR